MKKSFLVPLLALFLSLCGFSQQTITIGEGTYSTGSCVLAGYYGYHYSAIMYTLEDLEGISSGASITSIGYEVDQASGTTGSTIKVYLYEADALSTSSTWAQLRQNATLVYDGAVSGLTSNSWYTITFTTPYTYGGNNLIVLVESNGCTTEGGCSTTLKYDYAENAYVILQDETAPDTNTAISDFSNKYSYKPNTQITYTGGSGAVCYSVKGLKVDGSTNSTITLSWNIATNSTGYEYQYKTTDQEWSELSETDIYSVADTFATINNLAENTEYDIRVRTVCANGNSFWKTISGKTTCPVITSNDLPYIDGFESGEEGGEPDCWSIIDKYESTSYGYTTKYPTIGYDQYGYGYAYSGAYYFVLGLYNIVAMNGYSGDISKLQVTFQSKPSSDYYTEGKLAIGIMTDLSDTSTFTPIDTLFASDYESDYSDFLYKESIVPFNTYTVNDETATYYVVFKLLSNHYWYLDDVSLDITPDCEKATALTVDSLGINDVKLSWTQEGDNTSWTVWYKKAGDTAAYSQVNVSTTPSATLTNLDPQTEYNIIVKTNCGENPASSNILTIKTLCDIVTVDDENAWVEDFGNGAYCWTLPMVNGYLWDNSTPFSLMAYTNVDMDAISPTFNIASATTPYIKVKHSNTTPLKLYYRATENADWTLFAEIGMSASTVTDSFALPNPSTNYQVKIQSVGNYSWDYNYLYRVEVYNEQNAPACGKPYNLVVNATSTSTTLTWQQPDATETWVVYYKETSATDYIASDELIEASYTFSTLPSTSYDVYVEAVCGESQADYPTSSVLTFTTPCVGLTSTDIPKTWDFESNNVVTYATSWNTYSIPECWTHIGSYTCTYVLGSDYGSYSNSGSNCFYFDANAIAVLNPIDASLDVSTLQLSFYARTQYASYGGQGVLTVGVMTNPYDSTTFIPVTTINTPASYELYNVPLVYEGQGASYIAIKGTGGALIDDLTLEYAPQCTKPSNLNVSNLNSNGCTLTWDQVGTTSQWRIYYKQQDSETYDSTDVVTEKTYTFTNLEADNTYSIYVKALCSETESADSKVSTATIPCTSLTINDLPYSTSFEQDEENKAPSCWNVLESATQYTGITFPAVITSLYNTKTGNNSLDLYQNSTITLRGYQGNVSDLQLSFWAKPESASLYVGSLVVGVMTDLGDLSTFTPIDTFAATSWSNTNLVFQKLDASLTSYQMDDNITTYYITIKTMDNSYSDWFIDDVTLSLAPSCAAAKDITFTNITSTSADVTWTQEGDNTSWTLYYKKTADTTYNSIDVNDTPSTELTNLESATSYDVYIKTECGDNPPYSLTYSFRTSCPEDDMTITEDNIYLEDFESYNGNEMITCWTAIDQDASQPLGVIVEQNSWDDYAYLGQKGFYLTATYTHPKPTVALRKFSNDLTDLRLQFYYRSESAQSAGTLELGYITESDDSTTFEPLYSLANNQEWTSFTIDMGAFSDKLSQAESPRLALRQNASISYSYSYYSYYIDSLAISLTPTCAAATNIDITSVKDTTTISWYSNATSCDITIKDAQGNIAVSQTNYTASTLTTTALAYNTTYTLTITSNCSGATGETTTYTFTTSCAMITAEDLPKTFDFETDNYAVDWYEYPSCWTISGFYPIVSTDDNSNHYLSFSEYSYAQMYAALPQIDVSSVAMNTLQVTFEAKKDEYSYGATPIIYVGTMTDPTDGTTFTSIKSYTLTSAYTTYTVSLASYSGIAEYIAFYVDNQSVNLDNVVVDVLPACPKATNVTITNITSNGATVSWTQSDTMVTSWIVNYRISGATTWSTLPCDTTSVTLTNLQFGNNYEVRIEGVCEAGNNPFSSTQTFKTPCPVTVVTNTTAWEEDFTTEDNLSCWTIYSGWEVTENELYHDYNYGEDLEDAITPVLDISNVNVPALTFKRTQEDYENSDIVNTLTVLYRTTENGAWTELKTYNTVVEDAIDTIDLPNKTATYQLNFRWGDYSYEANGIYIDDIKVFNNSSDTTTPIAPCDAPTSLTASNISQTSATITWVGTASSYDVQLNNGDIENITATTKQLTNLTANTTYTIKVRSNCGESTSDWVTTTFTTLSDEPEPCDKPTNLDVVPTSNSLTLSWNGTADKYDVQLNDGEIQTVEQTIYTFANLTSNTTYTLKVRSNCGETTSDWATTTATTTDSSSLVDINNLVSVLTYPNPTTTDATLEVKGLTEDANVFVMDVNGKVVYRTIYTANQSSIKISTENLSAGVYYIKVTNSLVTKTQTLIKQ